MKPRLKTSKKWTAFPADFAAQIKASLRETFAENLRELELIVEGRIFQTEIIVRVGFREPKRLKQNNFEVSIDYKTDEAVDRIHDAIDAAASMMSDYFEADGDVEFPRLWEEYEFEEVKIYCQYSTVNTTLEAEADRLLGADEEALLHDLDEDEAEDSDEDSDEDEGQDSESDDDSGKDKKPAGGKKSASASKKKTPTEKSPRDKSKLH